MTETIKSRREVGVTAVQTAADKLFVDYTKAGAYQHGQLTHLEDFVICLGRRGTVVEPSINTLLGYRERTTDYVERNVANGDGAKRIRLERVTKTTNNRFRLLDLVQGLRRRARSETTIEVEVELILASPGKPKTWTINPQGELLVNGKSSGDSEEFEQMLEEIAELRLDGKIQ